MSWIKPLTIGSLTTTHNLVLAPLAGISNYPFRQICREFGANLTFSEMVSVDGLLYNNDNTRKLLKIFPHEHPIGFQFFGSDPAIFKKVLPQIESLRPDLIDLNFGCPVRKVVSRGAGAALLSDITALQKIVEIVKSSTPIPLTAKIRLGWDAETIVVVEAAQAIAAAGADAITVHARTRSQGYSGKASWEHIARVKAVSKIPVIGNGDVFDGPSAAQMFESTGVDGIMIARGALGQPWIFQHLLHYLDTGKLLPAPRIEERIKVLQKHYLLEVAEVGETVALSQMRKNFVWYTHGLPHSARLRDQIFQAGSYQQIEEIFTDYLKMGRQREVNTFTV
jgi:tRNA-dihydrouridine synthase B